MGILVYPPNSHQTESPTIFFIGSAIKSCVINGKEVELVYAGNFCPVFDLNIGENVFEINIDGVKSVFRITRLDHDVGLRPPRDDEFKTLQRTSYNDEFHCICLDSGHGGSARGTCSPKGITEKDLNLNLAKIIKTELDDKGLMTVFTRENDIDLSLADRVKIAQDANSDLFISIHHNAIPDHQNPIEHRGISVHYYYDENIALAEKLLKSLVELTGLSSAGVIKQNLHVLRENTKMPAVLIEFGYLIHPIESEIISGLEFQKKAAEAIASTLNRHPEEEPKATT